MAIIPEGKYVTDDCMQTLIQLIKNQFNTSLNNTIITRMSKTEYDLLPTKSSDTVYYVTDISTGTVECYLGDTKISGEGGGGDSEIYGIPFNIVGDIITENIDLFNYNFINVSYNDSYGTLSPGDNRYPGTLDYIWIDGMTQMKLTAYGINGDGLLWCAYLYNNDFSYDRNATSDNGFLSWADNNTIRNIPSNIKYIRFMLRNEARSELAPSGVREAWFSYTHNIVHIIPI